MLDRLFLFCGNLLLGAVLGGVGSLFGIGGGLIAIPVLGLLYGMDQQLAQGTALAHYVFDFTWTFSPLVWPAGMAVGGACTFAGGCVGLRHVLNQPPLQTLREA